MTDIYKYSPPRRRFPPTAQKRRDSAPPALEKLVRGVRIALASLLVILALVGLVQLAIKIAQGFRLPSAGPISRTELKL